jgi:hypothetical protein
VRPIQLNWKLGTNVNSVQRPHFPVTDANKARKSFAYYRIFIYSVTKLKTSKYALSGGEKPLIFYHFSPTRLFYNDPDGPKDAADQL